MDDSLTDYILVERSEYILDGKIPGWNFSRSAIIGWNWPESPDFFFSKISQSSPIYSRLQLITGIYLIFSGIIRPLLVDLDRIKFM